MSTYILNVESGLRFVRFDEFGFERECKAIAIMIHEQKGRNANPATYTFKLMECDEEVGEAYAGLTSQFMVSHRSTLMAVPVPRGEGE